MKNFTRLMLLGTMLFACLGGVKAAKVYEIDYSTKKGFPFYVMGYVPEWVGGIMTDYGANYKYVLKEGAGEASDVIVKTDDNVEYYRWTTGGDWHQYNIAANIPTTVTGTYAGLYTVKALVKASETSTFNVEMRWGWSGEPAPVVGSNVTIPQSDEFVEVEWSYSGIGGTSCQLIAQPGGSTATIEWKSLAVYSYDNTKNHVLKVTNSAAKANIWDNSATYTFAEKLTEGTKYTVSAKICAADVTRGAVMRFTLPAAEQSNCRYGGDKAILANTFTQVSQEFTASSDNDKLEIDLGFVNGRVYIDDVSVVAEGSSTNLVSNGNFEEAFSTAGWTVPGYTNQTIGHSEQAQGEVVLGVRKVTIGTTGWATMIAPDFAVSVPAEIDAYYAKYDNEKGNVKLTVIDNMARYGSAVINGEPGDYYFPQIDAGDVTSNNGDNGMSISWGSVVSDGTHYALGVISEKVGFVKVGNGVTIPSGKPYIVIPSVGPSREFIGFGEEDVTSIDATQMNRGKEITNSIFDLQGRRVSQPSKGLYIVNGKKVIIK